MASKVNLIWKNRKDTKITQYVDSKALDIIYKNTPEK